MRPSRFSVSNVSIKHRLPLLIGLLLLGIILASTWTSYRAVKQSALAVGSERLQNLTQQLANLSQQSTALLLTKTLKTANDPAIRTFLQAPSAETRPGASVILQQLTAAQDPNSLQVELWDANHSRLLTEPDGKPELLDLTTDLSQCVRDPFKAVGALRVVHGTVVSPAVAAVKGDSGKAIGCLVRWRRVSGNPEPQPLRDLLGSEAILYFGNKEGDVWTDLAKPVPKPPIDLASTLQLTHYRRDGNSMMALGQPIAGTPFFIVIEFPDRVVLVNVNHFLRRVIIVDAVLLSIGLLAAFTLSRSITRPPDLQTQSASGRAKDELLRTNESLEKALADLQTRTHELSSMTQQLWQASKLATMGELAASIAHELNNPLATVSLRTELLIAELAPDDPNRQSLLVVEQEVDRMTALVSKLLLFSRRGQRQVSTLNIVEELNYSLEFIDYHLRGQTTVVVTEFAEGLPSIQGDTQQLRQVFLNLLTNASDAMPEGGTLTVRAKPHTLQNGAGAVMIEFSDNGIGVRPEDMKRLWEPFFTTKPEGKGTGLGLPICRRTVEEHRGTIDLESLPGKGTTVRIILPATEGGSWPRD